MRSQSLSTHTPASADCVEAPAPRLHYDGSGRFFIRLGDEFASAMLKLMGKP